MKKIINGKLYDTETATCVGDDQFSDARDCKYWYERLYRKKNGEYFLYGEGGPDSKYAVIVGFTEWRGGEKIVPMDINEAKEWVEKHLSADAYIEEFGKPDE